MGQSHTTHRSQYQLQTYTVNYIRSIAQGGFSYVELVCDEKEQTKVSGYTHVFAYTHIHMFCFLCYIWDRWARKEQQWSLLLYMTNRINSMKSHDPRIMICDVFIYYHTPPVSSFFCSSMPWNASCVNPLNNSLSQKMKSPFTTPYNIKIYVVLSMHILQLSQQVVKFYYYFHIILYRYGILYICRWDRVLLGLMRRREMVRNESYNYNVTASHAKKHLFTITPVF